MAEYTVSKMTYFTAGLGRTACASASSSRRLVSSLSVGVSGLALMAGLFASSAAQAQCTHTGNTPLPANVWFPLGTGSGVNALTSVIETVNTAFLTSTSAFISAPGNVSPDQQGGGEWVRGIGGWVDTKSTGFLNVVIPDYAFGKGTATCNTTVQQTYGGFQVGHDISVLNDSTFGANWHFGVTGGYVESNAKDVTPFGGVDSPAGSLAANFQVPFAGLYGAATKGNFYIDGLARVDYYQAEVNDPVGSGLFNQRLDARGYSLTGDIGYRFDLPEKWFIEPSLGGVVSHVNVDPFDVSGTQVTGTGNGLQGTVQIHDFDSELGRASLRVGTTVATPDMIAQPFFTASVYHEFAGDVTTSISAISSNYLPGTGTLTTSRIGTYGQFGLGSSFQLVDTGWLGYARVDYRTGDNIEGWNLNAGLRYQFTPEAHLESLKDTPGSLKDAPVAWTGHDWTGLYVGGAAGGTIAYQHWDFASAGTSTNPDLAGVLVGGQAGYNYQVGQFVAGIEGDWDYTNARGGKACPNAFFFSCETDADQLGSVAARLGYTWGRALFYAKGGWAFGEVTAQGHLNPGTDSPYFYDAKTGKVEKYLHFLENPVSTTNWENGWTVGGGMEFALTDRWSAKAEYMHYSLGAASFTVGDRGSVASIPTSGDLVRVGLNYHIGLDTVPLPASYK